MSSPQIFHKTQDPVFVWNVPILADKYKQINKKMWLKMIWKPRTDPSGNLPHTHSEGQKVPEGKRPREGNVIATVQKNSLINNMDVQVWRLDEEILWDSSHL